MYFEVERIDGDYAYLKRTDETQDEPRLVARALLPDILWHGTGKKYVESIDAQGCGRPVDDPAKQEHRPSRETRASPIWYRPQYYEGKMYKPRKLLQVVGHTPVEEITRKGNLISCDVFSTRSTGEPIGTQEFPVIDTDTWEYFGVR